MGKKEFLFNIKLSGQTLVYFLIAIFVFMAITSFTIYSIVGDKAPTADRTPRQAVKAKQTKKVLPVLKGSSFPILSAQSVLAVDIDSETILYEKNPDSGLLPASTTKIITALVALDSLSLDRVVTVGKISVDGQRMGLYEGERITVENLLYGLLVFSANDAAEVLAASYCTENKTGKKEEENVCGREAFVEAMNEKAKELGMKDSNFTNPSGLDGQKQLTSARDLIRASKAAMKNPFFVKAVRIKKKTVASVDGEIVHRLVSTNELLGEVEGVLGVKTGWTENARENLVTYVERDGKKVMIALLGSQDRFGETEELTDWIFENYEWKEVSVP